MKWFITGVSKGIGLSIARAALTRGDQVVGTVRGAVDQIAFNALSPGKAHALLMDVTQPDAVETTVSAAETALGGIDVLVNNAGYGLIGAIEEASPDEIRKVFDVNVFGTIHVLQAVLPYMRGRRSGHIINVTSVSGYAPWAGSGVYGATKFAIEGLGRTLAEEVEELGIGVTNLAPGGFRTDFAKGSLNIVGRKIGDYDGKAREAERTLAAYKGHEPGNPEKLAQAVLQIAGMKRPPLHFLLGADAIGYAEEEMAEIQKDIDAWRSLSVATAF
ncbi:oxidoreductase [Asticcacaulis excentricus]|uniref:Short-chain dehydrogenase/reductase SDR n=1 Tax=Asticcacaulis excentricus (strain ATCC 15261 / DSM 4724 / KCTC 12464 / NCIMB 9791 / VKM B-1370 / CB 48) TaxID=573065 RepID=E8RUS3_ASTEC|nr:oxidoreductase [Asticcacaulis excentricus]ADU14123.1 short-chain dehydrogenase/reductase SDR [Asticcacaulis excentricus CB 48]